MNIKNTVLMTTLTLTGVALFSGMAKADTTDYSRVSPVPPGFEIRLISESDLINNSIAVQNDRKEQGYHVFSWTDTRTGKFGYYLSNPEKDDYIQLEPMLVEVKQ